MTLAACLDACQRVGGTLCGDEEEEEEEEEEGASDHDEAGQDDVGLGDDDRGASTVGASTLFRAEQGRKTNAFSPCFPFNWNN